MIASPAATGLELWLAGPAILEQREAAIPEPGAGEVVVRTRRTLISTGTELALYSGVAAPGTMWSELGRLPRPLGYSQAGEVVAVGSGVEEDWLGRRVATRAPHAAWVRWPRADLRPIPTAVSDDEAVFATLAGVVMNGLRRAGLDWGESVAVCGLGLVGNLSAQVAGAAGAGPVIALERSATRLALLPRRPWLYPATVEHARSMLELVRAETGGEGVDLCIEATADATLIPIASRLVRERGRLLLLSSPIGTTELDFHDLCNRRSLSIVGAHGSSQPPAGNEAWAWTSKRHAALFFQWLDEGRVEVAPLVTHRFPAERANEAYELLATRRGEALGVLLEWS